MSARKLWDRHLMRCIKLRPSYSFNKILKTRQMRLRRKIEVCDKNSSKSRHGGMKSHKEFGLEDDLAIIQFLLQSDHHKNVGGKEVWLGMSSQKVTEHSWQAMKKRFENVIQPQLQYYQISEESVRKLRAAGKSDAELHSLVTSSSDAVQDVTWRSKVDASNGRNRFVEKEHGSPSPRNSLQKPGRRSRSSFEDSNDDSLRKVQTKLRTKHLHVQVVPLDKQKAATGKSSTDSKSRRNSAIGKDTRNSDNEKGAGNSGNEKVARNSDNEKGARNSDNEKGARNSDNEKGARNSDNEKGARNSGNEKGARNSGNEKGARNSDNEKGARNSDNGKSKGNSATVKGRRSSASGTVEGNSSSSASSLCMPSKRTRPGKLSSVADQSPERKTRKTKESGKRDARQSSSETESPARETKNVSDSDVSEEIFSDYTSKKTWKAQTGVSCINNFIYSDSQSEEAKLGDNLEDVVLDDKGPAESSQLLICQSLMTWLDVRPEVFAQAVYMNSGNIDDAVHWLLFNRTESGDLVWDTKDDLDMLKDNEGTYKSLEQKYGEQLVLKRQQFLAQNFFSLFK